MSRYQVVTSRNAQAAEGWVERAYRAAHPAHTVRVARHLLYLAAVSHFAVRADSDFDAILRDYDAETKRGQGNAVEMTCELRAALEERYDDLALLFAQADERDGADRWRMKLLTLYAGTGRRNLKLVMYLAIRSYAAALEMATAGEGEGT